MNAKAVGRKALRRLVATSRKFVRVPRRAVVALAGWVGREFTAVELHVYTGLMLLSAGLWMLAPSYGLIGGGVVLMWLGLRGS